MIDLIVRWIVSGWQDRFLDDRRLIATMSMVMIFF